MEMDVETVKAIKKKKTTKQTNKSTTIFHGLFSTIEMTSKCS